MHALRTRTCKHTTCTTLLLLSHAQAEAQHVDTKAAVPQEFKFHFTCPYETAFGEVGVHKHAGCTSPSHAVA